MFALDGSSVQQLDALDTMGIAVHPSGDRMARIVRGFDHSIAELLIYDRDGIRKYLRLPDQKALHGLAWDGDALVAVSSGTNEVVSLTGDGEFVTAWQVGPLRADAWHLNCVSAGPAGLCVSASGQSDRADGWHDRIDGGVIVPVGSQTPVVAGLRRPHHPLWLDDSWLVCESAAGAVSRFSAVGQRQHSVEFGAWTRGMAADDRHVYVGLSTDREKHGPAESQLVTLDRDSLEELSRVAVPARELWEVVLVPEHLISAVRQGFAGGGAMAIAAAAASPRPVVTSDLALSPGDVQVTLTVREPRRLSDGRAQLTWTLENHGAAALSPVGAFPFRVAFRWSDGEQVLSDQQRSTFPAVLDPGGTLTGTATVSRPEGQITDLVLTISLIQELAWWLCDADPSHGVRLDSAAWVTS